MTSLIERFTSRQPDRPINKKSTMRIKAAPKKQLQARKKQIEQSIELIWVQHLIDLLLRHKLKVSAVIVVLMILSVPVLMAKTQWLPIEKIVLSGRFVQLKTDVLEKNLKPFLGKGFFSVNIKHVQQQLVQQPWVDKVSVRRVWPDQLNVSVTEKKAIARWDAVSLLSEQAVIFKEESSRFNFLPKINGYKEKSSEILNRYRVLQKRFSLAGLTIREISEDSKGATSLVLSDELRINLGSENNAMKINHLLAVYKKQIQPEAANIKYIDFRYSNGFAIAWKTEHYEKQVRIQKRGNMNV